MLVKREQHLGPTVYSVDRIDKRLYWMLTKIVKGTAQGFHGYMKM